MDFFPLVIGTVCAAAILYFIFYTTLAQSGILLYLHSLCLRAMFIIEYIVTNCEVNVEGSKWPTNPPYIISLLLTGAKWTIDLVIISILFSPLMFFCHERSWSKCDVRVIDFFAIAYFTLPKSSQIAFNSN